MVFDSNFNFSNHVSQVIKSTRVQARDLYRIRPLLDVNTSVLLANALVSSRLDYCNSLFLSLTDSELRRLQLVQNSLCRIVTSSSKFSHITHQLKKLHWLPVRSKVKVGVLRPVQQPGSYWDRSSELPLVRLEPTEVTAYD